MTRGRQRYKRLLLKVSIFLIPHLLAILLFAAGVVSAYVINKTDTQDPVDWTYNANPMGENYLVNENCADSSGEAAAIQKAAATWSNAGAKFTFSYGGTTTSSAPNGDGVNCISWSSTYQPFLDEPTTLAEATRWYNPTTGDISEVDCVFNDNKNWSTGATTPAGYFDVETVMLHEFGHYLSLGHSVAPAVMQPTVPSGAPRRTLTTDDIDGIIAIYGAAAGGPTLNQALDNANLTFTLGGNANWFPETTTSYYGGSAARSGAISNDQSSWLETTVVGPGNFSFYWKVSSEPDYDFLEFYIGAVRQARISGNVDWQQKFFSISAGSHTLKWVYVKDGSVIAGSDCGWLDKVVYPAPARIAPILPLLLY